MTDRDDLRVRQALQGKDFPATRNEVVEYATDRGERDDRVLQALAALPEAQYQNVGEVVTAVRQRPEQAD